MDDRQNVHHLEVGGKSIIVVGTAHISRESVELVQSVIEENQPETVCVELCESRFQAIEQRDQWENMDIIKVIKEKKAFLLLSNLMLASFQKRIAQKLNMTPGMEMIQAIASAREIGATIHLADRDIRTTLARTWRLIGFWSKIKLLAELIVSAGSVEEITEEDIEKMKQQDVLESLLSELEDSMPQVRSTLIDERDRYLTEKIRTAPGSKIVAVVGAGHVPGILRYWETEIELKKLEILPPTNPLFSALKWVIPAAIILMIILGFFTAGKAAGTSMITAWILANSILAGLGAIIAFGHPLTILAAAVAAPITSLNPMIAAGWVSGLVEAFSRKPKVRDFQQLPEDILSIRGFWRNKITRILLVVVFTNIGSVIGTFVAIPMMMKALG